MRTKLKLVAAYTCCNRIRKMSSQKIVQFTQQDIKKIIPKLSFNNHKGESGRIGVIGGSLEYTGAPYFAAITALRLGADLSHVFCTNAAGTAIKCYSPDLIVHPILNDDDVLEQMKVWIPRLHAVVIGPGLGRESQTVAVAEKILDLLRESHKTTIIDADGLFVVTRMPDLLKDFPNSLITPNEIEFQRLCKAVTGSNDVVNKEQEMASYFSSTTIVRKGKIDQIFNSTDKCVVEGGSSRRCGGQGDILSGAIALFLHWAKLANVENNKLLACFSACTFTKMLNNVTFENFGRSMITNDMIHNIPGVIHNLENM